MMKDKNASGHTNGNPAEATSYGAKATLSRRDLLKGAAVIAASPSVVGAAKAPLPTVAVILSQEVLRTTESSSGTTVTLGINVSAGVLEKPPGDYKVDELLPWKWGASPPTLAKVWGWRGDLNRWETITSPVTLIVYDDGQSGGAAPADVKAVARIAQMQLEAWILDHDKLPLEKLVYHDPSLLENSIKQTIGEDLPTILMQQSRLLPIGVAPTARLCVHLSFTTSVRYQGYIAVPVWTIQGLPLNPAPPPLIGGPFSKDQLYKLAANGNSVTIFTDPAVPYANASGGPFFDLNRWLVRNDPHGTGASDAAVSRNDWTLHLEDRTADAFDWSRIWLETLHRAMDLPNANVKTLQYGCHAVLAALREMTGGRQDVQRSDGTRIATHLIHLQPFRLSANEQDTTLSADELRRLDFLLRLDDARRDKEAKEKITTASPLLTWMKAQVARINGDTGTYSSPTTPFLDEKFYTDEKTIVLGRTREYLDQLDAFCGAIKQSNQFAWSAKDRWLGALKRPLKLDFKFRYDAINLKSSSDPDGWEVLRYRDWELQLQVSGSGTLNVSPDSKAPVPVSSQDALKRILFNKSVRFDPIGDVQIADIWITAPGVQQPASNDFLQKVEAALTALFPANNQPSTAFSTLFKQCLRTFEAPHWKRLADFSTPDNKSHRQTLENHLRQVLNTPQGWRPSQPDQPLLPLPPPPLWWQEIETVRTQVISAVAAETAGRAVPPEVDASGLGVQPSPTAAPVSFQVDRITHYDNVPDASDPHRRVSGLLLFMKNGEAAASSSPWRTANGASVAALSPGSTPHSVVRASPLDYSAGLNRGIISYDCQPLAAPSPLGDATEHKLELINTTAAPDFTKYGLVYGPPLKNQTPLPPLLFRRDNENRGDQADQAVLALVSNSGGLPPALWREGKYPDLLPEANDWKAALNSADIPNAYRRNFTYQRSVAVGPPQMGVDETWTKSSPKQLDAPTGSDNQSSRTTHIPQSEFAWTPEPDNPSTEAPPPIAPLNREIDTLVLSDAAPVRRWWDPVNGGQLRGGQVWTLRLPMIFLANTTPNLRVQLMSGPTQPPILDVTITRNPDNSVSWSGVSVPLTGRKTFLVRFVNDPTGIIVFLQNEKGEVASAPIPVIPGILTPPLNGAYVIVTGSEGSYLSEPQFAFDGGPPPVSRRADPPCLLLPLPAAYSERENIQQQRNKIIMHIRPPEVELDTWDRWPHVGLALSERKQVWAQQIWAANQANGASVDMQKLFSTGKQGDQPPPRLDDPAPAGMLVELVARPVRPGDMLPAVQRAVILWPVGSMNVTGHWERGQTSLTIQYTPASVASATARLVTATNNDLIVEVPPGAIAELRLFSLVNAHDAELFAGQRACTPLPGGQIRCSDVPNGFFTATYNGYLVASVATTLLIEGATYALPLPEELHAALDTFWDGNGLRVHLKDLSTAPALQNIGTATIFWQNFVWNGYPIDAFPAIRAGAGNPPHPHSVNGGRLDGIPVYAATMRDWDVGAFHGRDKEDVNQQEAVVRLAELLSADGARLLVPSQGRPLPQMLYWRVRATVRSRYYGLLKEDKEHQLSRQTGGRDPSRVALDPWRRAASAAHLTGSSAGLDPQAGNDNLSTLPVPVIVALLPILRRGLDMDREVHFLAVLRDRWYMVGGLAEVLNAEIIEAVPRPLPGSASQEPPQPEPQEIGRRPFTDIRPVTGSDWKLIVGPPFGHTQERDPALGPFQSATFPLELRKGDRRYTAEDIGGWMLRVRLQRMVCTGTDNQGKPQYAASAYTEPQWIEVIGHGELVAPEQVGHGVKASDLFLSGEFLNQRDPTPATVLVPPGLAVGHYLIERVVLLFNQAYDNAGSSTGLNSEWRIPTEMARGCQKLARAWPDQNINSVPGASWLVDLEMRRERLIGKGQETQTERIYLELNHPTPGSPSVVLLRGIEFAPAPTGVNDAMLTIRIGSDTARTYTVAPISGVLRQDVAIEVAATDNNLLTWTLYTRHTMLQGGGEWQMSGVPVTGSWPGGQNANPVPISVTNTGNSDTQAFFVAPVFAWDLWRTILPVDQSDIAKKDFSMREDTTARIVRILPLGKDASATTHIANEESASGQTHTGNQTAKTPASSVQQSPEFKRVREALMLAEAPVTWLFQDAAGRVLIGYWHEIATKEAAQLLPMRRLSGSIVQPKDRMDNWRHIRAAAHGLSRDDYAMMSDLRMQDDQTTQQQENSIFEQWLDNDMETAYADLQALFPETFANFPMAVREALLEERMTLGFRTFRNHKHLVAAVRRQDWRAAAEVAARVDVPTARNEEVRALFLSAAQ